MQPTAFVIAMLAAMNLIVTSWLALPSPTSAVEAGARPSEGKRQQGERGRLAQGGPRLQQTDGSEVMRPGRVFRDCGICPEMVVVPAGRYRMGSNAPGNEMPAHEVVIGRPFAVGKFAVTIAEWDACVAARSCTRSPPHDDANRDHPVVGVSWDDVTKEYLPWLKRVTGKNYRLLTETEWVYAARAEGARSDAVKTEQHHGPLPNGRAAGTGQSAEARLFGPNAFGLHDAGETVWEWVEDCYHKSYVGAPFDGTAWTTDCEVATYGTGILRVVRGASRNIVPPHLTAADVLPPLIAVSRNAGASGFRDKTRGFRVAASL